MDIIINKDTTAIVKKVKLVNLPDFIIITGENGTGKSQFLTYLYIQVPEILGYHDEMMLEDARSMYPERGEIVYDGIKEQYIPNVRIIDGQKELTNLSFRGIQVPTAQLGHQVNVAHLINQGRKFAHKFIFYKMLKNELSNDQEGILNDIAALNKKFLTETNYNLNHNNNRNIPNVFTKEDKITIENINKNHKDVDLGLIHFYYIAYLPSPNSNVFSTNIGFLFLQHWARIKAGLEVKESPVDVFNQIANEAKFRYILEEPNIRDSDTSIKLMMRDQDTGKSININDLSSGEKVILSLVLAIYNSNNANEFPEVILFDEPDSYLHPSLSQFMLNVLQNVLIKDKGIKVIMSTHSPSTVALAPEASLFRMDRTLGTIVKTTQKEAIQVLSNGILTFEEGIESFNILTKSSKRTVVCVEGKTDIIHIQTAMKKLNRNLDIELINLHDASSLSAFIRSIPATILDNKKILGLFDNDKEGRFQFNKIKGNNDTGYKILTSEQSGGLVFASLLPCADSRLEKYCPIEFLYSKEVLEAHNAIHLRDFSEFKALYKPTNSDVNEDKIMNEEFEKRSTLRAYKVNDNQKSIFADAIIGLNKKDFLGFVPLLDLLDRISKLQ